MSELEKENLKVKLSIFRFTNLTRVLLWLGFLGFAKISKVALDNMEPVELVFILIPTIIIFVFLVILVEGRLTLIDRASIEYVKELYERISKH